VTVSKENVSKQETVTKAAVSKVTTLTKKRDDLVASTTVETTVTNEVKEVSKGKNKSGGRKGKKGTGKKQTIKQGLIDVSVFKNPTPVMYQTQAATKRREATRLEEEWKLTE